MVNFTAIPTNMNELRSFVDRQPYTLNLPIDKLITGRFNNYNYPSHPPTAFILFRRNLYADPRYRHLRSKIVPRAKKEWNDLPEHGIKQFFKTISNACVLMHRKHL